MIIFPPLIFSMWQVNENDKFRAGNVSEIVYLSSAVFHMGFNMGKQHMIMNLVKNTTTAVMAPESITSSRKIKFFI